MNNLITLKLLNGIVRFSYKVFRTWTRKGIRTWSKSSQISIYYGINEYVTTGPIPRACRKSASSFRLLSVRIMIKMDQFVRMQSRIIWNIFSFAL